MIAMAQEWASLPDPRTGRSFHGGVGGNASHHSVAEVKAAMLAARKSGDFKKFRTGGMVNMSSKLGNIMQTFMMMNDGELRREAHEDMQPSIINVGGGEDEMEQGSHESITRSNYPDANLPARDNCPLSIYYRYHPSFNPQGFNP
jgi:hypothetical protein